MLILIPIVKYLKAFNKRLIAFIGNLVVKT